MAERQFAQGFAQRLAQRRLMIGVLLLALLGIIQGAPLAGIIEFEKLRRLAAERFGPDAVNAVQDWEAFVASRSADPILSKLQTTNDFFNERIRWSSDERIYGIEDYWATPLETLGKQEADCEDFTIAKYVTLLALGVDPKSLRLIYVKAQRPGGASQAHMVLAWYETPAAAPLILDNINTLVLPAARRQDLTPVFSFNADDLWISGATQPSKANPLQRLSRWQQVLERIVEEGFRATW
ncbi:transglutaminase-like cysteine peptidase [Congregibacter litoralis]|uniref:Putative periplasmic protein n=1 Tax=Congregibacter litoralis KT71 TaxID=314285 RepID=A4A588_9GAMM|nr:transglutaminase-like cysteine peptidase [Congregibacter litoralis]EAQ98959.1 putative periplasmic protein [Congregibacter litoralis KT71]